MKAFKSLLKLAETSETF